MDKFFFDSKDDDDKDDDRDNQSEKIQGDETFDGEDLDPYKKSAC